MRSSLKSSTSLSLGKRFLKHLGLGFRVSRRLRQGRWACLWEHMPWPQGSGLSACSRPEYARLRFKHSSTCIRSTGQQTLNLTFMLKMLGFRVPCFNTFFLKGNIFATEVYTFFSPWLLKSPE